MRMVSGRSEVGAPHLSTEPLRSLIVGEDAPGDVCKTDYDIREFLHGTSTTFCHPSGTCKMGQDAHGGGG